MKKKLTLLIALSITLITMFGCMLLAPIETAEAENCSSADTTTSSEEVDPVVPLGKEESESKIASSITTKKVKTPAKTKPIKKTPVKNKSKTSKEIKVKDKYTISSNARSFKSWMPYTAITNKDSKAYKLQQKAYSDNNGLRKIGNDYCVAMGTYYGKVGDRLKITMSTGTTFTVILSDIKSDKHTDSTHRYTISNGCMMEFLIDRSCLNSAIKRAGNVGALKKFSGTFVKVEKII